MEVGAYSSSGKEHLSSNPRRRSQQELGPRPAPVLIEKKDQERKVNSQSRVIDHVEADNAKAQLSSRSRRHSLQEFDSRPALLLNQKKDQERKVISQSKVMDQPGAYSASDKEHLSSNPRRRSQQEFHLDSRPPIQNQAHQEVKSNKSRPVWDCGSSLYDSFERDSFKRQLDSAISCRTMSMPHLSDRRAPPPLPLPLPPPPSATSPPTKKHSSNKLSRSIHRLLRSVFKPHKQSNNNNSGAVFSVPPPHIKDGFYVVYDKTGALTTIPEVVPHEFDFDQLSPEIGALVRRSGSERFTATTTSNIGISCA